MTAETAGFEGAADPESGFGPGCLAVAPGGKLLAFVGAADEVVVVDRTPARGKLRPVGAGVHSVAFSSDRRLLACGGGGFAGAPEETVVERGTVAIHDAATGKRVRALAGHRAGVVAVAWSPDGKRLASAARDGTVLFWDAGP